MAALNGIELSGTLLEDIVVTDKQEGRIRIAYSTVPLQVTITSPRRKCIFKVIEDAGNGTAVPSEKTWVQRQARRIDTHPQ